MGQFWPQPDPCTAWFKGLTSQWDRCPSRWRTQQAVASLWPRQLKGPVGTESFDGQTRDCGLVFLWLSQSGGPQEIPGPALGLFPSGTRLMTLTLAPHMPSNSRCLLSSSKGSRRPTGICRGGPWVFVLEPHQAAAQSAGSIEPHQPVHQAELRAGTVKALSRAHLQEAVPPSLLQPGPQAGPLMSSLMTTAASFLVSCLHFPPTPPPPSSPAKFSNPESGRLSLC